MDNELLNLELEIKPAELQGNGLCGNGIMGNGISYSDEFDFDSYLNELSL